MSKGLRIFFWALVNTFLLWFCLTTVVNAAPAAVINGADVPAGEQPWVVGILQPLPMIILPSFVAAP
jgi:hypothetical protein